MITDDSLHLVLIVGSARPGRLADALLPWLETRLREQPWAKVSVLDLATIELDWDAPLGQQPGPAAELLDDADGFVVLTPEYNHSIPAVLKQLIDAHHDEWAYKPVACVTYGARSGGLRAVEALRTIFGELRAVIPRQAVMLSSPWRTVGPDGPDAAAEGALAATIAELQWWTLTLRAGRWSYPAPA